MKRKHKKAPNWQKGANTASNSFNLIINFEGDRCNHFFREEEPAPYKTTQIVWYEKELQNLVDQNTAKINATY